MKTKKKKTYLDITGAIEIYNANNPNKTINREKLAKKVKTSYQTLTNYQGGKIPLSVVTFINIIKVLGIENINDLIKKK